jgi:hypothetical protein
VKEEHMRRLLAVVLICALTTPVWASAADFARIRKGSRVHIILSTGDECSGKVVARTEVDLSVKLADSTSACGNRDSVVTIRHTNMRAADTNAPSVGKQIAVAAAGGVAVAGLARGTGALAASGHETAALFLFFGGVAAVTAVMHMKRKTAGYSLYVSRLE